MTTPENGAERIDALLAEMREGLHRSAPLREQIPLILRLADEFERAGRRDTAAEFRAKADALVPLRNYEDAYDRRGWAPWPFRRRKASHA